MADAPKETLPGRQAVLEGLPDHPAVKAILSWSPEALTDALFDRGELTLTVPPENIIATVTSIHEHGYTAVKGDLQHVALFWILFAAIDLTAGLVAFALERRENWRLMLWLIPQRFGYRQIMYYVVIKALVQALRGPRVGWSSIARSGQVQVTARKR